MYTCKKTFRSLTALALAAAGFLGTAQAAPMVSISPSSQDLLVGSSTSVDIIVSGLNLPSEAVGGFAITLDFNGSLLSGLSYLLDPAARMGTFDSDNDFSLDFGLGTLDLFYVAAAAQDQNSLSALQTGGSFTLARVSFEGIAPGLSPLSLSAVDLSEWDGQTTIASNTRNGSICVGGDCNRVPEPATYGLAGIALLAAGWAGRARRRKEVIA